MHVRDQVIDSDSLKFEEEGKDRGRGSRLWISERQPVVGLQSLNVCRLLPMRRGREGE